MKKRISVLSAILCLLMLFCMFSACEKIPSSEPESVAPSETTSGVEETQEETQSLKEFTGVITQILSDGSISVTLCEAHRKVFGADVVKIPRECIGSLQLTVGSEIMGTALRVEETDPPTLYIYDIMILDDNTDKPVIYLYPEVPTVCSVRLDFDGILTCTYPTHGANGWQNFIAMPDGTLIFPDGREYYCLYWEGKANYEFDFSKGFCVKGSDTAAFLQEILPKLGLTAREANEFIIYWLPILQNSPYNVISFQQEAYTDAAKLNISPAPDSLLRVFMAAYPVDSAVDIEPQEFNGFVRNGFTVVEWGGSYAGERAE